MRNQAASEVDPLSDTRLPIHARRDLRVRVAADLAIAVTLALLCGPAIAAECIRYEDATHPMGVVRTETGQSAVAVNGTHAYVVEWDGYLRVMDIVDPYQPRLVGSFDLSQHYNVIGIAVQGSYAYITQYNGRLIVVNVADPANPRLVCDVAVPGVFGIAVSGAYAYLIGDGFHVVDISDRRNPRIVSSIGNAYGAWIVLSGNHAYAADFDGGLLVIDISDPENPLLAATLDTPSHYSLAVAVAGSFAFIAGDDYMGRGLLDVIDVSNPSLPRLVASVGMPWWEPWSAVASGSRLYIADHENGLFAVDVADPEHPVLWENLTFPQDYGVYGVACAPAAAGRGSRVYVAGYVRYDMAFAGWFQVFKFPGSPHAAPTGRINVPCCAISVAQARRYAYVTRRNRGLQIVDVNDPEHPALKGAVDIPGYSNDVAAAENGTIAVVAAGYEAVFVIDVSDPEAPLVAGHVDTPEYAGHVELAGDYAYVPSGNAGLLVVDISSPENPTIVGVCDTPGHARDVAVAGTLAYVANSTPGFVVIDISDPHNPVLVGSLDTIDVGYCVAASGRFAYLTSAPMGLHVIDVADPANPRVLGSTTTLEDPGHLAASKLFLYASVQQGVQIFDVSNPERPRAMGFMNVQRYSSGVAVSDSRVYTVDNANGSSLYIFPTQCAPKITPGAGGPKPARPGGPTLRAIAFPNPVRGETRIRLSLPDPGSVTVSIWDVTGRRIRALFDGTAGACARDLIWDGRDDAGNAAASGIYWLRVTTDRENTSQRLVFLRGTN